MNSEAEIVIAFLYKRSGKTKLTKAEIYLPLSLELGWYTTKESYEFINSAIKNNLLEKKGDLLYPNFDIEKINVPIGFYPLKKNFKEVQFENENNNRIDIIVNRIATNENQDYDMIIKKINKISLEKRIIKEVAALLVAKEFDIDFSDIIKVMKKNYLI